jgi:polyisoprenyl-teichoic acid--peptidoglycan teichoic acid transferase
MTGSMKRRWKRVVLWVGLGAVVVVLALAGGSYLWFRSEVGASNKRVDPEIIQALQEKPSTTLAPEISSTTSSLAPVTTTSSSVVPGPTITTTPLPSTTTVSEATTTTSPFETPTGMNLVLVGYDKRAEGSSEVTEGRSDTIILVHIDPEKGFLSLLSVPRDLRVVVKGYGHRKINAAYAFGGGALLIRTIQSELGVDLDHYVAVDLEAFKAITNALGGVYVDVDRTYDDGKIELDPGYQLLDGLNALRFVRTRHDQNIDFGRMERQQRFLSAVREQVMTWNLPFKLPGLIKGFVDNADTDLSANELIKLAYWVTKLDSGGMKRAEIIGPTGSINGSFYILPSEKAIAAAVQDFFTPPVRSTTPADGSPSPPGSAPPSTAALSAVALSGSSVDVVNASGRLGQAALAAVWLDRQGASIVDVREADKALAGLGEVRYPSGRVSAAQNVARALGIEKVQRSTGVTRVTVVLGDGYEITGEQVAAAKGTPDRLSVWRPLQKKAGFALLAPTYLPRSLSYSFSRSYNIDPKKKDKPAVRVGYRYQGEDLYLGISATAWRDAPLAAPGVKVQGDDGIVYTVVGTSNKADHVWWVKNDVLYWVSNTLFAELTREQMLAIALSTVEVPAAN